LLMGKTFDTSIIFCSLCVNFEKFVVLQGDRTFFSSFTKILKSVAKKILFGKPRIHLTLNHLYNILHSLLFRRSAIKRDSLSSIFKRPGSMLLPVLKN